MVHDSFAPSSLHAEWAHVGNHRLTAEEVTELEKRIQSATNVLKARQHGAKAIAIPESTRRREHKFAYAMRAEACLKLYRAEEALVDLDAAIELDGGYAYAYGLRASAHTQLRNFFAAQADHRKAEECAPEGAGLRLEADMRRLCTARGLARAFFGVFVALAQDLQRVGSRVLRGMKHAWARRPF